MGLIYVEIVVIERPVSGMLHQIIETRNRFTGRVIFSEDMCEWMPRCRCYNDKNQTE